MSIATGGVRPTAFKTGDVLEAAGIAARLMEKNPHLEEVDAAEGERRKANCDRIREIVSEAEAEVAEATARIEAERDAKIAELLK